ncbi:hypothetical protein L218DRAFT_967003, partial [Marasmius fiardii PR-910]
MICGLTHQNEQPSHPPRFECSGDAASPDRTLPTKLSSQNPEKGKERESVARDSAAYLIVMVSYLIKAGLHRRLPWLVRM